MTEVERRYTGVPVEARAASDRQHIAGYASMFNKPSSNLGGFIEIVERSAFNKSRGDGWPGVVARYNHDDNQLLGTTDARTMQLTVDETGLWYEVDPPKARADVLELVQRGDVRHSSFAFRAMEDDWKLSEQGYPLRSLLSVQLIDVAPVNVPAYPDTTAALRSLAKAKNADPDDIRHLAQGNELRKLFVVTGGPAVVRPVKKTFGPLALAELNNRASDPYAK